MTQKTRFKNMEDFGYGPNVMRKTKVYQFPKVAQMYLKHIPSMFQPGRR